MTTTEGNAKWIYLLQNTNNTRFNVNYIYSPCTLWNGRYIFKTCSPFRGNGISRLDKTIK